MTSTPFELRLLGCAPEPLGSYLKALGAFRLVAEQADVRAQAYWAPDAFVVRTDMDHAALVDFFTLRYRPTPVLSPWNSSSGFGREGVDELGRIERSEGPRLEPYRAAIGSARRLMASQRWADADRAKDPKREKVMLCRAVLPDETVRWMDAAIVLTADGTAFPPVLGTGGNDGRLEFSRNFHQRVLDALAVTSSEVASREWLDDALAGTATARLVQGTPGQYDGSSAGGPNSSATGQAPSLLNPWDWVLLIEGSLLLASGSTRKLATDAVGLAAAPFTARVAAVGYPSAADGERSRGELWLPLWERPSTLAEAARVFAEGRAEWRGRQARTGLEFAKAVGSLGADRGIPAFSRHGLLERNGLATVAVPLGRVQAGTVHPAVAAGLAQIDRWVDRLRRAALPAGLARDLRALDTAVYALVASRAPAIDVLLALAALQDSVARSPAARELVGASLGLRGSDWVPVLLADGEDVELRLALSLASASERDARGRVTGGLGTLLLPRWERSRFTPAAIEGLALRPTPEVLALAHARRVVECQQAQLMSGASQVGVPTRYSRGTPPILADLAALVDGDVDTVRLGRLLRATLLLRIADRIEWPSAELGITGPTPELALLGPFYAAQPDDPARRLRPAANWPRRLASGALSPVLRDAALRLQIAELGRSPVARYGAPSWGLIQSPAARSARVGAALLWPLGRRESAALLDRSCPAELQLSPAQPPPDPGRTLDDPT